MGARPLPGVEPDNEVPDYAPNWEAPRQVLPDWDAA
jgi:hypothetical protein